MCSLCHYKSGLRGNLDKHIRTVHQLDVVTKHTVHLKMKFKGRQSGDILSKDGELVNVVQDHRGEDPRRLQVKLNCVIRNLSSGFLTRSDTKGTVQLQKMARVLKFLLWEVEGYYYLFSENKGADQLLGYRAADLCLCFHIYAKSRFSDFSFVTACIIPMFGPPRIHEH